MALFRTDLNAIPPSERLFVKALMVVLFCFAAAHVSIFISPKIADVGRWIGMAAALLFGFVWQNKNDRFSLIKYKIDLLIWGLLIAYLMSALDSVAEDKSLLYLAVCVLQIVLFTLMSRRLSLESWRLIYGSLLMLCVVVSFMGLGGYASNPGKFIVHGRLSGLGNANSMGLVAMVGALISMAKFFFAEMQDTHNWKRWKLFYFLGGIGCLSSLVLSGSRSSLGGMFSGILIVLFFSGRAPRTILGLLAFIPLMPFFNLLLETGLQQKVVSAYARPEEGDILYTRRYVWEQAIDYFKENPWLGKGYAVHDALGNIIDGSGYHGLLASVGIVGTIMFMCIVFWILLRLFRRGRMLIKNKSYLPGNRELMALGGGSLVALLVQGVGEPWMIGPGSLMHVVYWLSAGACIAAIMFPQEPRSY